MLMTLTCSGQGHWIVHKSASATCRVSLFPALSASPVADAVVGPTWPVVAVRKLASLWRRGGQYLPILSEYLQHVSPRTVLMWLVSWQWLVTVMRLVCCGVAKPIDSRLVAVSGIHRYQVPCNTSWHCDTCLIQNSEHTVHCLARRQRIRICLMIRLPHKSALARCGKHSYP